MLAGGLVRGGVCDTVFVEYCYYFLPGAHYRGFARQDNIQVFAEEENLVRLFSLNNLKNTSTIFSPLKILPSRLRTFFSRLRVFYSWLRIFSN